MKRESGDLKDIKDIIGKYLEYEIKISAHYLKKINEGKRDLQNL